MPKPVNATAKRRSATAPRRPRTPGVSRPRRLARDYKIDPAAVAAAITGRRSALVVLGLAGATEKKS